MEKIPAMLSPLLHLPRKNHLEVLVLLPSHKKEKKLLTLYIHTTHKPPCCISKANLTCNKVIIMAQKSCQVGREKKKNPSNSPTICRILGIYFYNDDDMQLFGYDKVRKKGAWKTSGTAAVVCYLHYSWSLSSTEESIRKAFLSHFIC